MLERKRRALTFLKEKKVIMHNVCFLAILWYNQSDNDP